jgi:hypothetical protein
MLSKSDSGHNARRMKERFKRFMSLAIALKELQPHIVSGQQIQTGKPFKNFGEMRPREALGNWLICVVSNFEAAADCFFFTTDPSGGVGCRKSVFL